MIGNEGLPARTLLHTRKVLCRGYVRSDGMIEVEAELEDISARGTDLHFKRLRAGEALHGLRLAVTLDAELVIRRAEVHTDIVPTHWCADGTPAYQRLVGLKIGRGFTRQVKELLGGTQGCAHLTELLGPLATTAMQTWYALRRDAGAPGRPAHDADDGPLPKPHIVDSCHAYRQDGEAVRIIWPEHRRRP